MSGNKLKGSTRSFDIISAHDKFNSLGPKRSIERNILKITFFHRNQSFWILFPFIIECDKHVGKFYKGLKGFLTNSLEVITWLLWDIRCCWKHKFLKKKRQTFQLRKDSGLFCLVLLNLINVRNHFERVHKVF